MEDFTTYLLSCQRVIDEHVADISGLLKNGLVKESCMEYDSVKSDRPEDKMNVFRIFTDRFYLEKFHDLMISFFLDPKEKHNEGYKFLFAFIDFINKYFKDIDKEIHKSDYTSAVVDTQYEYIDILIKSVATHHCIIIEDKMYNAEDRPRQLPNYYDKMAAEGYKVDAIVYLPLDVNKHPNKSDWTQRDKENVDKLLCEVPGYRRNGVCLVDGWILPCTLLTNNLDCVSTLRQYADLIKYLNYDIMDNEILGKFYAALQKEKSLETAQTVSEMLPKLPYYMTSRMLNVLNNMELPLGLKIWQWEKHSDHCGIMYETDTTWYKLDVFTTETRYKIKLFGHIKEGNGRNSEWAKGMQSLSSFNLVDNVYINERYSFYDEEKVIECVKAIVPEMYERLRGLNSPQV